jgi:hypothetical protein
MYWIQKVCSKSQCARGAWKSRAAATERQAGGGQKRYPPWFSHSIIFKDCGLTLLRTVSAWIEEEWMVFKLKLVWCKLRLAQNCLRVRQRSTEDWVEGFVPWPKYSWLLLWKISAFPIRILEKKLEEFCCHIHNSDHKSWKTPICTLYFILKWCFPAFPIGNGFI